MAHARYRTQAVVERDEQVGLDAPAEVERLVMTVDLRSQLVAPHQRGGAGAEHVREVQRRGARERWRAGDHAFATPPIARLVAPVPDAVELHVDEIGRPAPIKVDEEEAGGVDGMSRRGASAMRTRGPNRPCPRLGQYSTAPSCTATMSASPSPFMSAEAHAPVRVIEAHVGE